MHRPRFSRRHCLLTLLVAAGIPPARAKAFPNRPLPGPPADLAQLLACETAAYRMLIDSSGITVE